MKSLIVVNTGNIKYKKPVEIVLTSGDLVENVIEKVSLGPGESKEFNLGYYVGSGVYTVEVAGETYDEVYITGTKKISYDWIYWVVIIAFLALLVYLFLFRGKRLRNLVKKRKEEKIEATYKMVDTCAAEFEAKTPYYYSSYEGENEATASDKKKVIILGAGPIRIGQGVEFDYCTVHAVLELRELGYEAIIINNNPETVSTDFDTSDTSGAGSGKTGD